MLKIVVVSLPIGPVIFKFKMNFRTKNLEIGRTSGREVGIGKEVKTREIEKRKTDTGTEMIDTRRKRINPKIGMKDIGRVDTSRGEAE